MTLVLSDTRRHTNFSAMNFYILCLVLTLRTITSSAQITPLSEVIESNEAFAKKFSDIAIRTHPSDNVVCSPLSAHVILALLANGAGRNTRRQLNDAICVFNSDCLAPEGLKPWISKFKDVKNVNINLANKIYTKSGLELNEGYQMLAQDAFLAEVSAMKGTSTEVADDVNAWVSGKTNQKINQLISKDDITADTSLILLDAIYFNADWKTPFNKNKTAYRDFYGFNNVKTKVLSMSHFKISLFTGVITNFNATFVEIPYKNPEYKMIIIMPIQIRFNKILFEELGQKLKSFQYSELRNFGKIQNVTLTLPKFTVETSINLQPVLEKMGVTDMFSGVADFGGITKNPINHLKVDKIVQKTLITVNEVGSEAASATAALASLRSGGSNVYINRPFYFAIVSDAAVLFQGSITLPKE